MSTPTIKCRNERRRFDIELEDYYVALLWMLTGEKPAFRKGIFQPINPLKSIWSGGRGGLGLAIRYDHWEAGSDVYDTLIQPGISIRRQTPTRLLLIGGSILLCVSLLITPVPNSTNRF